MQETEITLQLVGRFLLTEPELIILQTSFKASKFFIMKAMLFFACVCEGNRHSEKCLTQHP